MAARREEALDVRRRTIFIEAIDVRGWIAWRIRLRIQPEQTTTSTYDGSVSDKHDVRIKQGTSDDGRKQHTDQKKKNVLIESFFYDLLSGGSGG